MNQNNEKEEKVKEEAVKDETVKHKFSSDGQVIKFGNKYTTLITKTAMILALTILLQYVGHYAFEGVFSTIFVGSLVNMCLFIASVTVGILGGAVVAFLTPFVAFLTGHMGFPPLIIFIGIANFLQVITASLLLKKINIENKWVVAVIFIISASIVKFLAMYFGVLNMAEVLGAMPAQLIAFQLNFSWPQLVSAICGGCLSLPVIIGLKKARMI